MPDDLIVATYNLHGGVDAWGRPFDVAASVHALDADVVCLQECWVPAGEIGSAEIAAAALGGHARTAVLASGRRALPHPNAPDRWDRPRSYLDGDHALFLDSERPLRRSIATSQRFAEATHGAWGIGIASRLPIVSSSVIDLGRLRRDPASRVLLVAEIAVGDTTILVGCVHMSHLTQGSPIQFRRLFRAIDDVSGPDRAMVLGGDMNAWGPVVTLQLPRWRRAVKGATWPSWRPHSQLDHIMAAPGIEVLGGRVVHDEASDHLPVVAHVRRRPM